MTLSARDSANRPAASEPRLVFRRSSDGFYVAAPRSSGRLPFRRSRIEQLFVQIQRAEQSRLVTDEQPEAQQSARAKAETKGEPSMEEVMASIRRIISEEEDLSSREPSFGTPEFFEFEQLDSVEIEGVEPSKTDAEFVRSAKQVASSRGLTLGQYLNVLMTQEDEFFGTPSAEANLQRRSKAG